MSNLLYKGIVRLTTKDTGATSIIYNTGTERLGRIICDSLIPGRTVDDRYKPCKLNLFIGNYPCFNRVVPITGSIYGPVNDLPEEIKSIVVSKASTEEAKDITLNDVSLGFVRFISAMIKTKEDNFSKSSSNSIRLSLFNAVNEELAYIEEDSYKTLSTAYDEIKSGKEVIVDWFMLIVNSQVI